MTICNRFRLGEHLEICWKLGVCDSKGDAHKGTNNNSNGYFSQEIDCHHNKVQQHIRTSIIVTSSNVGHKCLTKKIVLVLDGWNRKVYKGYVTKTR